MGVAKAIPHLAEPPIVGSALEFVRDRIAVLRRVASECGDVGLFHLWRVPVVLLNRAEHAHSVLIENARDFDRIKLPPAVGATFGEGVFGTRRGSREHLRQRKMLQHAFRPRPVAAYAGLMLDCAEPIEQAWQDGQIIPVQRELEKITITIASRALFGVDLQSEVEALNDVVVNLLDLLEEEMKRPFPIPLWIPIPHNRRVRRTVARLDRTLGAVIARRRREPDGQGDLLTLLLTSRYENGEPLSDQEVRDQATTMFMGAHEEMAVSLTWVWSLLATHPQVYERMLREGDAVLEGRSRPTVEDLERLPFTLQVFKETMRLYGPVDILTPRIALRDVEVDGYRIRRGTRVIISPHLLHRKPEYFPDPEAFDPDRFAAEREKQMPPHTYFPFGSGQHNCIGKYFATLEAHLLLASVSQKVRFELVEGQSLSPRALFTLRPKEEIKMRVRRRPHARNLLALLALALLLVGCSKRAPEPRRGARDQPNRSAVTALGRVVPGRAVISIAAQPGSRLLMLAVSDGKKVSAGEVLAHLETYPLRIAERDAARVALEEARDRLASETAYGKALIEQNRQAARVLEIGVERERRELKRVESLTAALAGRSLDDQKFQLDSREGELAKANAELRAAEAALARTESTVAVKSAEARLKAAEAQLELSIIRAPCDGEILKVFTYPGERIGNDPILKMGDTADMNVIAEVHESDIGAVQVGQRAVISSAALTEPVQGVVEEIGRMIHRTAILDLDPRAEQDGRIVEVRIQLDRPEPVAGLSHLEVSTRIDTLPGAQSAAR